MSVSIVVVGQHSTDVKVFPFHQKKWAIMEAKTVASMMSDNGRYEIEMIDSDNHDYYATIGEEGDYVFVETKIPNKCIQDGDL